MPDPAFEPAGYLWRKMESGIPAYPNNLAKPQHDDLLFLDTRSQAGILPDLVRWKGLEEAFIGYVSRGCREPHAVVYDLDQVESVISRRLGKSGFEPDDEFHVRLYIRTNILGVWLGEKTPFLFSAQKNPDTIAPKDGFLAQ